MSRSCRSLLLIPIAALPSAARPQTPDPFELLAQAAEAARAVESASFHAQVFAEGPGVDIPNVDGRFEASFPERDGRARFRAEMKIWMPAAGAHHELVAAHDGAQVSWLMRAQRIGCSAPASGTWPDYVTEAYSLVPEPFLAARPYERELVADDVRYEGRQACMGVDCDVVLASGPDGLRVRWFLGAGDLLPRRLEHLAKEGGRVIRIWQDVQARAEPGPNVSASLPEGTIGVGNGRLPRLAFTDADDSQPPRTTFAPPSDPYLTRLRQEHALDGVIAGKTTDLERVRAICRWVHGRWQHSGDNQPMQPDPLSILREAAEGKRFRCVEYAQVACACLLSVGVPARVLGITTPDVEIRRSGAGHVVCEAFLADQRRWVFVDPQLDVVPTRAGEPLNAVDLQDALARGTELDLGSSVVERYPDWAAEGLFHFRASLDHRYGPDVSAAGRAELLLLAAGVDPPRAFQRRFGTESAVVTRSVSTFYAPPDGATETGLRR